MAKNKTKTKKYKTNPANWFKERAEKKGMDYWTYLKEYKGNRKLPVVRVPMAEVIAEQDRIKAERREAKRNTKN